MEFFIYIQNYAGGWPEFQFVYYLFISKTMLEVGQSFILWPMLYLVDWSSRSKLFYCCGLMLMFSRSITYSIRVSGIPSSSVGSAGPISSTAPLLVLAESSDKFVFFLLGLDKSGMSEGTVIIYQVYTVTGN